MTQINCAAVLFDMDGVLVDSTPAVERVWTAWALEHGLVPEEVVRQAHGRPSLATIIELLPHGDHDAENRDVERREIEDIADVVSLPGALHLLQSIPESRWTVVTSATRALAEVRLRAAGLPVPKHLVTASDLSRGKPFPDPYLKGAELLRTPASDCLVVEDAPSGIRSGKAAGARVLAVLTTSTALELAAAGADWLADNLRALSLAPGAQGPALALLLREKK
ncbi:MAG TPA: HAD-IA family hydrolase [Candidatus Acidoferrum sp.]|jgi:sugar-phosphatase|nr:HAD-IA family hydrolase [Candidatus Acidoferrum sp.]